MAGIKQLLMMKRRLTSMSEPVVRQHACCCIPHDVEPHEYACCAPPAAVRSTPPVCRRGWQTAGDTQHRVRVLAQAACHMQPLQQRACCCQDRWRTCMCTCQSWMFDEVGDSKAPHADFKSGNRLLHAQCKGQQCTASPGECGRQGGVRRGWQQRVQRSRAASAMCKCQRSAAQLHL